MNLSAQIDTIDILDTKGIEKPQLESKNDVENFYGVNVKKYIGEILYVNGKAESLQKYGYSDFIKNYKKPSYDAWEYQKLVGRYFLVESIIPDPKNNQNTLYLRLKDTRNGEIVFFKYDPRYNFKFPFINLRYYEQLKTKYIGKTFVVQGENWLSAKQPMTDIKTGEIVQEFEKGRYWKCSDVLVETKYYTLSLIITNSIGQQIPLPVDNLRGQKWVLSEEKAMEEQINKNTKRNEELQYYYNQGVLCGERKKSTISDEYRFSDSWGEPGDYVKSFITGYEIGKENFLNNLEKIRYKFSDYEYSAIVDQKIVIGMSEEGLLLSWGEPDEINRTVDSYHTNKQYVYKLSKLQSKYTYVYVEDGKVISWQD